MVFFLSVLPISGQSPHQLRCQVVFSKHQCNPERLQLTAVFVLLKSLLSVAMVLGDTTLYYLLTKS